MLHWAGEALLVAIEDAAGELAIFPYFWRAFHDWSTVLFMAAFHRIPVMRLCRKARSEAKEKSKRK